MLFKLYLICNFIDHNNSSMIATLMVVLKRDGSIAFDAFCVLSLMFKPIIVLQYNIISPSTRVVHCDFISPRFLKPFFIRSCVEFSQHLGVL